MSSGHSTQDQVSIAAASHALGRAFAALLSHPWDPHHATQLHARVDELAAAADTAGSSNVAESAIALSVFLCSFVDGDRVPTPDHRAHMRALVDAIQPLVEGSTRSPGDSLAVNARMHSTRGIVVLGSDDVLARALAREPALAEYEILPVQDVDLAAELASRFCKLCLLVEPGALGSLHGVMREISQRPAPSEGERALCVAIVPRENTLQRLGALRAGAHFVIRDGTPPAEMAAELRQRFDADRGHHFRVLIVDDDPSQSHFCEIVLRHRGLLTEVCNDPTEALAAIEVFRPDIILVDLHMPKLSGIELTARIREQRGRDFIPILFLSGEEDKEAQLDAITIGGDAFLMKPIQPRHLVAEVTTRAQRARDLKHGIDRGRYGSI